LATKGLAQEVETFQCTVHAGNTIEITQSRIEFQDYCQHIFTDMSNGSVGIVQKIDFEIRPDLGFTAFKTSRKEVLDNPSVCLSVRLSVAFVANSHGRKGQPIELKL